ncbi:hypothetical protein DXG03_001186 [Asterophora parasitica]|uniref:Fungal-type protein kinase domain-containing protein n=1 Tax=Asterophora parasitica TaxID=117018 RepID=A0A9P7K8N5_9AGAR|nr:hypothetical protein DXG03_001186 [Asterophora parasitica]
MTSTSQFSPTNFPPTSGYTGDPFVDSNIRCPDRSETIVSEKFNYHSGALIDYLWRCSHLNAAERGRNSHIRLPTPEKEVLAQRAFSESSHKVTHPVIGFTVPFQGTKIGEFIAWGSIVSPESLPAQCTRVSPVLELMDTTKQYFVKDAWRAHDLAPGSGTHVERKSKGVEHTRPVVGDLAYTTMTVVSEQATSSRHLMQVCSDAYVGLRQGYERCGYIHKNVSGKNILIDKHGLGVLNDWDLAVPKTKLELKLRRRHEKTGTWEFMSSLLLSSICNRRNSQKVHTIQDDMESFLYVVFYYCLRYFPHNKGTSTLYIMKNVFHDHSNFGGEGKQCLIFCLSYICDDFWFTTEPLQRWFAFALNAFKQWLEFADPKIPLLARRGSTSLTAYKDTSNPPDHFDLKDHNFMEALFKTVLESTDWPDSDDAPKDSLPGLRKQAAITRSRTYGI